MTEQNESNEKPAADAKEAAPVKPPKYDWADPKIPAGNAPAMPRWPLIVSGAAFAFWLCFLIAMAIVRTRTVSF
ncbi:MAG: hypothetical protein H6817_11830 [Phycisphaerales bacterium]|nr:hypothetical protein [Phycisphaerales bacterium]